MHSKYKSEEEEIFDDIEKESSKISSAELDEVLKNENRITKKASKLNIVKFTRLLKQLGLSLLMLKDYKTKAYTQIPWRTIALIIGAVLYFINPFDLIPDFLPIIGYTDDALAFAAVFKSAQKDLKIYCEWKGLNPEEYF